MLYSKEATSKKLARIQEKNLREKENTINEQIEKEKEFQENKRKIKKDIDTALGIGTFSALGFGAMGWANGGVIGASVACIGCATLSFAADSGFSIIMTIKKKMNHLQLIK